MERKGETQRGSRAVSASQEEAAEYTGHGVVGLGAEAG